MQGFSTFRPRTGTGSWLLVQTLAACRRSSVCSEGASMLHRYTASCQGGRASDSGVQPPVRTLGNQTQGTASCENGGASDSEHGLM